jgi:UDP-N-acetylglucosamine--N-acetylmuramyl-(pentapeptide) pyrophosphoryl-undecaprenol N-acetylglucosamine transferase
MLHPDFYLEYPSGSIEWKTNKKHIYVSCGSQGSRIIYQTLLNQKKDFPDAEWIISLGTLNRNLREQFNIWEDTQLFDWIDAKDIPHILDGTDVAITRASATTLAELTTRSIRLIIIPLAISAGNHQFYNGKIYEKLGHKLIDEITFSGDIR